MKTCSYCKIEKHIHAFNKAKANKDGFEGQCKECRNIVQRKWASKNRKALCEKVKSYRKKKYHEDIEFKEKVKQQTKTHYAKHKDDINLKRRTDVDYKTKRRQKSRDRYKKDPTKVKEHRKKYCKKYTFKITALSAKRHAAKLLRTPNWLSKSQLNEIETYYSQASELSKTTNIAHHVDHIIPLQGKNVSGLHVPWNLQILTASENCRKSNKV